MDVNNMSKEEMILEILKALENIDNNHREIEKSNREIAEELKTMNEELDTILL